MLELFKNILGSDYGSLGFVLGLSLLSFYIVWLISKYKEKFDNFQKKHNDSKNDFDSKLLGTEERLEKSVTKLDQTIDTIRTDLSEIKGYINLQKNAKTGYAEAHSPLSLTDKGMETAKKLDVDVILNREWKKVKTDIKNELGTDSNPYDIQEICFSLGNKYFSYLNEKETDHTKNIAFSEGVDLSAFDIIFGIKIRNKYFEEHDIDTNKIDQYKP